MYIKFNLYIMASTLGVHNSGLDSLCFKNLSYESKHLQELTERNLKEFYFNLHLKVGNFFIRDDRDSHGWARKNRQAAQPLYE